MYKHYKEQYLQMKEIDESQIKNKYLHAAIIKLKDILKKIDIDVDIPTQNYFDFFKWIAKKAIWAAILLFFSILTTISCSNLLLQYISGVTTTKIAVNKNGSVPFPPSTVCLPMYGLNFYKLDTSFNIRNASQYLHSSVNKYFENQNHDKETFLNSSSWSPAMLLVVYKYVSHLHFIENNEWTMDTELIFSEYKIELQTKDWWKAGRTLEKEMTMLNISISELTEAVGQAIAKKFNLGIIYYTAYDGRMNSSYFSYKTRFVGSSWICYNFDFFGLVLTSQDETIVLKVNASSLSIALRNDFAVTFKHYILFAPSADFHMDLKVLAVNNSDDPPLITDYYFRRRKNYYLGRINEDSYISYDPVQMYRFMTIINGQQQCLEVRSMEICRAQCRASLIKNLCNCVATSLTMVEDMSWECTLTSYGNCLVYDANNDSMCECLKPCTRWDYEMKEQSFYHSYRDFSGRFIIRLAKLDYRIFNQTYLWKMEDFIGAFGGALSLWLGLDFLMAISFFSIVVAKLINAIIKRKHPLSSSDVIYQGQTRLKEQDDKQKRNQAAGKNETEKRIAGDKLLTIKAIKPSNWNCFKVLSFIVNLIFFLATFVMCVRLFQKYLSDPPIIEMNIAYDETFELPKSTEIILPMYSIDLELNIKKTLYGKKVEEYFGHHLMNKEAFLSRSDAWPPEIFALCFKYLAYLSAVEGTDLEYWETMNFSEQVRSINVDFLRKSYSGELYDAAFQLEKKLSQMEVTIKELKLSVAEKLKSAFQLSVKYVYAIDGVVTKENISMIENTCIGEWRVCFRADFSTKPIRNPGHYIEISTKINHSILPISDEYEKNSELIVDFDGQIMRNVRNVGYNVDSMVGLYGFLTTFKVFIIDAYRKIQLVKGETQCINYEKKDQCRWQCRSEMMYSKCNCTTISLPPPYLPLGPECSFSIYSKCLQYTKQDDMQCINQCLKPCEKWKYQIFMEKLIAREINEAIIQIQVQKYDYAMYTEKLSWTYDKIAGAIGGALGLWLGLDFVIMIGAISELLGYTLTRLLQKLGLKKMNGGTKVSDRVQLNEASKKHLEESNELYFTSAILTWWKKSFKMLIKALYSMKLGVILKLIVFKTVGGFLAILFCFLTFNMCLLSIKQYLKNPTTTKMQFSLNNTFIMPTSTLCVPVTQYSLEYFLGFGGNINYESMMVEYFAQNQENKEAFLNAMDQQWPSYMSSIIYKYLYTFNTAEGRILQSDNPCPMELTYSGKCPDLFHLWENEWKAIFKLETILKQMNVSRSELLQSFGQQTLKIYNISILHIAEEENKLIKKRIEIRETSSVDFDFGVCFKINFSGAAIRSEAELFNISIDSNGLSYKTWESWMYFNLQGLYKPDDIFYDSIWYEFGRSITYIIGAKEFNQVFPGKKDKPDCAEYVSPEVCRWECRANLIKRLCNCTPASLPIREVSSSSDECTLAAYQNCLKYYAADDIECRKNCSWPCTRATYKWKFDDDFIIGNEFKINLILRVEDFGYPVFEEQYEWTFEEFLGAFGGNLGLWMGLDVKTVLGEIFSIVFVIGKQLMAFIKVKIAGNVVIVI